MIIFSLKNGSFGEIEEQRKLHQQKYQYAYRMLETNHSLTFTVRVEIP